MVCRERLASVPREIHVILPKLREKNNRGYPVARFTFHYSILNRIFIVNEQTPHEPKKGYNLGKYSYIFLEKEPKSNLI